VAKKPQEVVNGTNHRQVKKKIKAKMMSLPLHPAT
jgi:hypothetical protein